MFQIDQKSRKSIYEQVVDNISEFIMRGILAPGDKLPSIRELSKQLLINPNTVAKAYKELESKGYIYTELGLGTFVSEIDKSSVDKKRLEAVMEQLEYCINELSYMGLDAEKIQELVKEIIEKRGEKNDQD